MNNKLLLMLPTIIKAEPTSDSDHQEHLTILIASGKLAKKMIWQDLTHDQVKRLSEKDIEKYFKRCETSLSAWTCNGNVKAVLKLLCKALAHFLPVYEG